MKLVEQVSKDEEYDYARVSVIAELLEANIGKQYTIRPSRTEQVEAVQFRLGNIDKVAEWLHGKDYIVNYYGSDDSKITPMCGLYTYPAYNKMYDDYMEGGLVVLIGQYLVAHTDTEWGTVSVEVVDSSTFRGRYTLLDTKCDVKVPTIYTLNPERTIWSYTFDVCKDAKDLESLHTSLRVLTQLSDTGNHAYVLHTNGIMEFIHTSTYTLTYTRVEEIHKDIAGYATRIKGYLNVITHGDSIVVYDNGVVDTVNKFEYKELIGEH